MSSFDPRMRSLLQKAVRRGYSEIADRAALRLVEQGDWKWLKARTAIILFEECWPLAGAMPEEMSVDGCRELLRAASKAKKNKEAAGLGTMALALSNKEDVSRYLLRGDSHAVRIVSAGIDRQEDFFRWAHKSVAADRDGYLIKVAETWIKKASWPWDKAFMIAGSYLSLRGDLSTPSTETVFPEDPYVAALDKHTPEGKRAMAEVARRTGADLESLKWASFYFSSASTNEASESPWFEMEKRYRFAQLGLTVDQGRELWGKHRDEVFSRLKTDAEKLEKDTSTSKQLSFF